MSYLDSGFLRMSMEDSNSAGQICWSQIGRLVSELRVLPDKNKCPRTKTSGFFSTLNMLNMLLVWCLFSRITLGFRIYQIFQIDGTNSRRKLYTMVFNHQQQRSRISMFKSFRKNIWTFLHGPTRDPRPTSTPPKLLQVLKVNQQQKGSRRPESGGWGGSILRPWGVTSIWDELLRYRKPTGKKQKHKHYC